MLYNRIPQLLTGFFLEQRLVVAVGDVEDIPGLFTGGGDLGIVNTYVAFDERLGDARQQAGSVRGGDVHHRDVLAGQLFETHIGIHLEVFLHP